MDGFISVIVPVYNVEKYLKQCIDSILAYDGALEVIAVNDGSTDGSLEILNSYRDSRLSVYSKPNQGILDTWKFGVEHSHGKYVIFVDSDDYVSDELFPIVENVIENSGGGGDRSTSFSSAGRRLFPTLLRLLSETEGSKRGNIPLKG